MLIFFLKAYPTARGVARVVLGGKKRVDDCFGEGRRQRATVFFSCSPPLGITSMRLGMKGREENPSRPHHCYLFISAVSWKKGKKGTGVGSRIEAVRDHSLSSMLSARGRSQGV